MQPVGLTKILGETAPEGSAGQLTSPEPALPGTTPLPPPATPPLDPPPGDATRLPDGLRLVPWDRLGLSKRKWDEIALKLYNEFGDLMDIKLTARVLMVNNFSTMEQVEVCLRIAREIAENKDVSTQDKLLAVRMTAEAAKAQVLLNQQAMSLAEKSNAKPVSEKVRPQPPQMPVQINVGAGPASVTFASGPAAPATNGGVVDMPEKSATR